MNVSSFLKHWNIAENPFMAEEARQDDVFARIHMASSHPDFPKILGDPSRPASAVVFGEKGSGKTAIRLQIADAVEDSNQKDADNKTLVIAYDELNPVLDRFARRIKAKSPLETLRRFRLIDHIDGVLSVAVPDLVDVAMGRVSEGHVELGPDASQKFRNLASDIRQDWMLLQALYDRPDQAAERTRALKRRLRYRRIVWLNPLKWISIVLWVLLAASIIAYAIAFGNTIEAVWLLAMLVVIVLTVLASGKYVLDRARRARLARLLSRQLNVLDRSSDSFRRSLNHLPNEALDPTTLPVDDLDDQRYAMLERLRRAVQPFGFMNIFVLVDRVDEPTLVNGETDRMKAVVWPMFNNKFLQLPHFAFKLMLPIELRHELRRQSAEFFQEARLDKQNMIDRLTWSGATLYDLCNARLLACLDDGVEPISVSDLFDDSVTRQDVVDALDQMRQPRDAFKLMYQAIQQHCSQTTEEEADWRIPRLTLDQVRRSQSDRLESLQRGIAPA